RKSRLLAKRVPREELRSELEKLNVGRLRLAAKGVERTARDKPPSHTSVEEQKQRGMFMLGSIAALRHDLTDISSLHHQVAEGSHQLLHSLSPKEEAEEPPPPPIAIVGMACIYPDAPDLPTFWRNILANHDAIREVPPHRWESAQYF